MPTSRILPPGPPLVTFRTDDGKRVLQRELVVDLGQHLPALHAWSENPARIRLSDAGTTVLRVHEGYVYDGASIPSALLLRWIMGPRELYEVAAALHDPLYGWQAPRDASDLVFWIVARSGSRRVGPKRGWAGWAALRAFGWRAYWRAGRM